MEDIPVHFFCICYGICGSERDTHPQCFRLHILKCLDLLWRQVSCRARGALTLNTHADVSQFEAWLC